MGGNLAMFAALVLILALGVVSFVLYRIQFSSEARLKRRVEDVIGVIQKDGARDSGPKGGGRKKAIQAKLKELEEKQKGQKAKEGIRELIAQAGMSITPKQFYIYSAITAIVSGLFYIIMGYNPLFTPLVMIAMGLGAPRWYLKYKIKKRMKAFNKLFVDALDVIVRGIRTGLPVGECMTIVANEISDPVGIEFKMIVEGQKLGLTQDEVLERSIKRVPTAEFKFFTIVMVIQRQTGGNLADTLGKLSDVLRQRFKLRDKIQALSSEAKASAGIIGSLPFVVGGALFLINPEYVLRLFNDPIGHVLVGGGAVWMSLGVFVMWRMINFDF